MSLLTSLRPWTREVNLTPGEFLTAGERIASAHAWPRVDAAADEHRKTTVAATERETTAESEPRRVVT